MLQRYKKNRTSASFLLTKCATFLIKCYWGTFSVPSSATSSFWVAQDARGRVWAFEVGERSEVGALDSLSLRNTK